MQVIPSSNLVKSITRTVVVTHDIRVMQSAPKKIETENPPMSIFEKKN